MTYDWRPTATRSRATDTDPNISSSLGPGHEGTSGAATRRHHRGARRSDEFVEAAEAGRALNRSGRPYKPSALRDLRGILEYHVAQESGDLPLREVRREHVQALVDRLGADGLSESRIRSVISALRALYGHAIERAHVEFNPADGLVMPQADAPAPTGERDATSPWSDRLGELWQEPAAVGGPAAADRTTPDGKTSPCGRTSPCARTGPRARAGSPRATARPYQPMALLPERILSLGAFAGLSSCSSCSSPSPP